MIYDINGNIIGAKKPNNSFIHLSFDDVVHCVRHLASGTLTSIFDDPFFGMLKEFHDKYGAVFSLYVYQLSSTFAGLPTKYQQEFIDNSDWLKFGFHQNTTGALDATHDVAMGYYNTFINGVYTLCGGVNSVDRMPRLDYYGGNLEACQGLRDANCGIIGLLNTDDSRNAYYLSSDVLTYLKSNSLYFDRTNGLAFMDTVMRLDWFVSGFSSEYTYNTPVESTPYEELKYRYNQPNMGRLYKNLVVFTHEWRVYNSSYQITASMKTMIEQVCRFGQEYGYDFDFPMNRVPNINSFSLSS